MPFNMSWLVENRVIMSIGWGESPVDEFREANRFITDYIHRGIASGSKRVHLYVNLGHVTHQANPFLVGGEMTVHRESGLGYIVNSGRGNLLARTYANFLARVSGFPIHFFDEPEHAFSFLRLKEPTLPDMFPAYQAKIDDLRRRNCLPPDRLDSTG